jgi:hypothetical protein
MYHTNKRRWKKNVSCTEQMVMPRYTGGITEVKRDTWPATFSLLRTDISFDLDCAGMDWASSSY